MDNQKMPTPWKQAIQLGLIGGGIALLISLIGMVTAFGARAIISGIITMGQVLILAPILLFSYTVIKRAGIQSTRFVLILGLLAGLMGGVVLSTFMLIGYLINLRVMFVNASSELYSMLAFGLRLPLGIVSPLLIGLVMGAISAGVFLLPARWQKSIVQAGLWVLVLGLLRDLIITMISRWGVIAYIFNWLFALMGLTIPGAVIVFVVVGGIQFWRFRKLKIEKPRRPAGQQRIIRWVTLAGIAIILMVLPPVLGIFFSDILDNVGLFILMGLGLNIVVGFAGLLDLGYVAFYAIGAYTVAVLTSPELGFFNFTYWQALPFALGMSVLAGIILGLPVLRMRGDYLAIVTLGFGEIVRLLALSDWLRPWLGGTQGIQLIQRPKIGPWELATQQQLYYLILIGVAIAAFIAWRLKDSRLGRSWMALREDEDVAQAMGLDLVLTKLMAFATGAFFAGLSGTIFAAKLTAAYPSSFNFLISINVLSVIIIGGMGSIPGVVVGSLALVGLPELLREFAEFRLLVYGAVLVAMMLTRPEGLWPEARRKLELIQEKEEFAPETEPPPL
jgi:branched-chain amino acid transport system permease protein